MHNVALRSASLPYGGKMGKKKAVKVNVTTRLHPELLEKLHKEAEKQSANLGFRVTVTDVITQACRKLLRLI